MTTKYCKLNVASLGHKKRVAFLNYKLFNVKLF
jgi:hypothetical protein